MRISIVGAGYVGSVTGAGLAELGHSVLLVDINQSKIEQFRQGHVPIYEPGLAEMVERNVREGRLEFSTGIADAVARAEVIFVAVGTPPRQDGEADLTAIETVCRDIGRCLDGYRLIVEKSTVPVNTCENIRRVINLNCRNGSDYDLVSNPEFLREGSALQDFFHADRIVVGAESDRARRTMQEVYAPLLTGTYHAGRGEHVPVPVYVATDIKSAELIKHASNAFLAMKISFINAVSVLTELSGANISDVAKGIGLDARIGRAFLDAGLGYGGSCFPKDLKAFWRISEQLGYDFRLLREVDAINEDQKARFLRKIRRAVWNLKEKTITILGLAFKPNTDDIREAPAIDIARQLLAEGATVRAYDPKAMVNAAAVAPEISYCQDAYSAVKDSDCLVLCTDWEEFRCLDLERVHELMRYPIVVDGRNCFDPERLAELGFEYNSVGRAVAEAARPAVRIA